MKIQVSVVVVALAFVSFTFIVTSTQNYSQLHFQLSDFTKKLDDSPDYFSNRYITLYGHVEEGSVIRRGASAEFFIVAGNLRLFVTFGGNNEVLPDTFQDGSQVSLEGVYNIEKEHFVAYKVMAKCASKYESRVE